MLEKSGAGYYVVNKKSGKKYSGKPISKAKAEAQMRLLQMVAPK